VIDRLEAPPPGPAVGIRFPDVIRDTLDRGFDLWTVPQPGVPVAAVMLVLDRGSSADPPAKPGLAGLTSDLLDEGAGARDALELADAFARLGCELEIEVGADVTTLGVTTLTRHLSTAIALIGDVAMRPRLEPAAFNRVRELRTARLRQLSRSPSAAADRVFLEAVHGTHPYGHGTLGTIEALEACTLDDARAHWEAELASSGAALIVAGAVAPGAVRAAVEAAFTGWRGSAPLGLHQVGVPDAPAVGQVLLVDRPGAAQSELRVGHQGPPRRTPAYHALVTMNAVIGGQFTSRLNRTLREDRGVTYGVRTAFEFRRSAGSFACETSVATEATADSAAEILREFASLQDPAQLGEDELARAKSSLTRGYARHFETAVQLARAAAHLVTHRLDVGTYDEFVPRIEAVTADDVARAAHAVLRPDASTIVVVGDAEQCRAPLELLGWPVVMTTPKF
jgi:predicted Zn-dependent peptidase